MKRNSRVQQLYEGHAREACVQMLAETEKFFARLGTGGSQSFFNLLSADVLSKRTDSGRPMSVCVALGDLRIFALLFDRQIDETCSSAIRDSSNRILSAVGPENRGKEFNRILELDLKSTVKAYRPYVQAMARESSRYGSLSEDEFSDVYSDWLYVDATRPLADQILASTQCIDVSKGVIELAHQMRLDDPILVKAWHKAYERDSDFLGSPDWLMTPTARYLWPPEIRWWWWLRLEREETRPIQEIFGFDFGEVRRRIDAIAPGRPDRDSLDPGPQR